MVDPVTPPNTDAPPVVTPPPAPKNFRAIESQEEFDRMIGPRLAAIDKKWEDKITQEKDELEQKRLEAEGKHKERADRLGSENGTLKSDLMIVRSQLTDIEAILKEAVDTETNGWPQEVLNLMPADSSPLIERYRWMVNSRALVARLSALPNAGTQGGALNVAPPPGNRQGPPPSGTPSDAQVRQQLANEMRASGRVSI